jgi:uncharacterized membrane protein
MFDLKPPTTPRRRRLAQTAHVYWKLIISAAVGVLLWAALHWGIINTLQDEPRRVIQFLAAWNAAIVVYLALAAWVVARHEHSHMRALFVEEDVGAALILAAVLAVAAVSVVAIFSGLGTGNKANRLSPVLAMLSIVLSWIFVHTIFAFHYAHEYYGEDDGKQKGGLLFPKADEQKKAAPPEYGDFLYFSFVIGMTFQVSDVQITSRSLRRLVLVHGVVSFFYNVAVLALMVNMGGEFIKG